MVGLLEVSVGLRCKISASVRDMQWYDKASEHRVRIWWEVREVKVQKKSCRPNRVSDGGGKSP